MRRLQFSAPGFYPGLIAGLLASATMILFGRLWGAPVPPQLLSDRLTAIIPLEIFSSVLGQLESSAKPLTFVLLIAGQILVGGLIGALLLKPMRDGASPSLMLLLVLFGTWGVLALIIAPLGGVGLAGMDSTAGIGRTALAFVLVAATFAASLVLGLYGASGRFAADFNPGRRKAIGLIGYGIPAVLGVAYLGRFFEGLATRSHVKTPESFSGQLFPALTPFEDFYVVSKNFVDPDVALGNWSLQVEGLVDNPREFSYDELRARPSVKQIATLTCISNEVGGYYISNGEWTGFRFGEFLEEHGIQPGVVDVVLHAADDYTDSIPLAAALDPDTILVYELNGQQLDRDHGFPLRLVVPGIYGMKNVKWITKIELVDYDHMGYWQEREWSDAAIINTMSRIDAPMRNSQVFIGQPLLVGGIAFSGDREISRVELSFDDRNTWVDAEIEEPLSPLSWVRWTYEWTPDNTETTYIWVRATDGQGVVQTDEINPPLPDGSTGYHRLRVRVAQPEA